MCPPTYIIEDPVHNTEDCNNRISSLDSMADTQNDEDSKSGVDSLATRLATHNKSPDCTSFCDTLAQEVMSLNDEGSRSQDSKSGVNGSNVIRQGEREAHEETSDISSDDDFDSSATFMQRLGTTMLTHETDFLATESITEPCVCSCHNRSFDEEKRNPQLGQDVTPLARWKAQGPSEEPDIYHWGDHSNFSLRQACCSHLLMETSESSGDDSADEEGDGSAGYEGDHSAGEEGRCKKMIPIRSMNVT